MLKRILGAGSAVVAVACMVNGCGGDTSDPSDDAASRDDSTTDDSMTDDSTTDDSTTDDSTTDDSTTDDSSPIGNEFCSQTPVPNSNITTFAADTYTVGSEIGGDAWGHDMSLTGEAFTYVGGDSTIEREQVAEGMRVFGTSDSYTGFGISFGPCSDASQFYGIGFTIQGVLGDEGELQVQVQMAPNYPSENDRGGCMFSSEATKWEECTNNFYNTEGTNPDEAIDIQLNWSDITGGLPNDTLDPKELLGIQWQFNCGSTCDYDVVLSNVRFLEEPAVPLDLGEADDTASDDASADDTATDDAPTDDASDDTSTDDAGDDTSTDDTSTDDAGDDTSTDDASTDDAGDDTSTDDASTDDAGDDASTDDTSTDDAGDDTSTDDVGDDTSTDDAGDDTSTDDAGDDTSTDDAGDDTSTDE